jgi:hypothetical protein
MSLSDPKSLVGFSPMAKAIIWPTAMIAEETV